MKTICLLSVLLLATALWLPGKEIVVKMAVKRGQTTIDREILPLVCITFVLDKAAMPVNEARFINTNTKDRWIGLVRCVDPTHPKVLTAMQGEHRSLVMLILRLEPGRYNWREVEFEGRNRSLFFTDASDTTQFYFDVKPNCVNFVGSLVIGVDWSRVSVGYGELPASITVEQTAHRDKKWATDVVPGMSGLLSVESVIEKVQANKLPLPTPASVTPAACAPVAPPSRAGDR